MSGNLSFLSPTATAPPTDFPYNSSLGQTPPPQWEAPAFTRAAQFRVAATLILFLFAAVSNLSVLASVALGRGRRLAAHLRPLIASLAAADLMMTFVVMPLDAVWNVTLFAMHSAAFILVVISLDRHRAILHPFDSLDAGQRNKRMLLLAWSLSLLLASPQLFIFRAIKAEGVDFTQCVTHGSFESRWQETVYNMFHFVTLYVVPLLAMSCCYTRILLEISRQMRKSKDGEACLRRSGTDTIPKARMKTLKMTIVIVVSFVVCLDAVLPAGDLVLVSSRRCCRSRPSTFTTSSSSSATSTPAATRSSTACTPRPSGPTWRPAACRRRRLPDSSPKSLDRLSPARRGPPQWRDGVRRPQRRSAQRRPQVDTLPVPFLGQKFGGKSCLHSVAPWD
ncbi:hypothetical protein SKAU_G00409130 [Synaphobranchus kaupii]|uniref:G-protein coupled receptors family 1 profile domain-containing protein n=1 Tax=Synaphobranchus kaupii TaxID=118154 RepID=A0A9Q1EAM1_SYNKA|nr:hypothetical protein SKAU_G00409130 [Synaphobranchus kaupii]